METGLRALSVSSSGLIRWVVPSLAVAAICAWQLYAESKKADPGYVAVLVACITLWVIYLFIARKQFSGRADDVLDGGEFLRIKVGPVSEDISLANVESIEGSTQFLLTIAALRLKTPGRLGKEIEFFPLAKRNAVGENEVVANLRARIAAANGNAI